jgi:hypothetical protein
VVLITTLALIVACGSQKADPVIAFLATLHTTPYRDRGSTR